MTTPSIGDNGQLRSYVERIERIEGEIAERQEDRKEIYSEAKAAGFDAKILRKVVTIRKQDAAKQREEQELLETYMVSLGMISDLPLGKAAIERFEAPE
jgi:uncharacterized protein (UPF0335 family)